MNFLKKLFAVPPPQNPVQYFYVRPRGCPDVIQVRIIARTGTSFQLHVVSVVLCCPPHVTHLLRATPFEKC